MRTPLALAAAAALSCVLLSCSPKEPDLAGLKKAVDGYNDASKTALMGGDMDKAISYFADDGMEMPPNMPMTKGRDEIKAVWTKMMSSGMKMSAVSFTSLDAQAGGSIGYDVGTYEMTVTGPNMPETKDKGKYVSVWHQMSDGTWKLAAETWNSDMPMPSMEKPPMKAMKKK